MSRYFISFKQEIQNLLDSLIENSYAHGIWLNTLSYLENCGARKLAAIEHPTAVREEMLKHASEEFRHAFLLKKQLTRIGQRHLDYARVDLLGGWAAYHYLHALDLQTFRYLKTLNLDLEKTKKLSYLLVTYAIELRAGELYPIYQETLKRHRSKISVQSILLEEQGHLQEMEKELDCVAAPTVSIETVCRCEASLCERWLSACKNTIMATTRLH